jgi:hypothetical protein
MSYVCYQTEELRNERIAKKVTQKKMISNLVR